MALDFQRMPIAFGQGLSTKSDPKQLPAGRMTTLENATFQIGQELNKRNGYAALSKNIISGGTISAGVDVQTFQSELVELDGQSLYSYNDANTDWVNKGALVTTTLSTSSVIRNNTQQTIQDSAINGSLRCFVWYDSVGQLGYSVFDSLTNQSVVNNQALDALGTAVKVLAFGTKFVIIYFETGASSLKYKTVDISTPTTLSASVSIATDIQVSNHAFDASVYNSRIYIAYASTTNNRVNMYYLDSGFTKSSQLVVVTSVTPSAITVVGDASFNSWVSYSATASADDVYVFVANPNLTTTTLASTILDSSPTDGARNITGVVSGTIGTFYYECPRITGFVSTELTPNLVRSNTMTLAGVAGSSAVFNRGIGLASKAFSYSGVNYFWASFDSNLQSSYFLMNGSDIIVAKLSSDLGGGYSAHSILPEVNLISSGRYQMASLIKDFVFSSNGDEFTQTGVLSAEFSFSQVAPPSITLGQNLLLSGGIINMYDGASVVEHGYSIYPEGLSSTFQAGTPSIGGGLGIGTASTLVNQVQYSGVYEWTDNQGQIHRSAPSPPVTVNLPIEETTIVSGSTHGNSSILTGNISSVAVVGDTVNVIGFSSGGPGQPFLTYTYNATVATNSSGTVTLSGSYNIVASTISFIVSKHALAMYWLGSPQYGTQGNCFAGQLLIPLPLSGTTGAISDFPPGTYVTDVSTGATSEPRIGAAGASAMYYSADVYQVTITFPTLKLTSKAKVALALYRTEVNGTQFYRTTAANVLTLNDKTVDSVSITDTSSDLSLIGNEQLYTTGEIENIEAPAIRTITSFKSRAIAIPSEADLSWWFSKQVIPGSPVEFTDSFVKNVDSKISSIKAVGVLDEKLIFFGPGSKYYIVGDGPGASGANDDFSQAQHITGATGCSNQSSILEVPIGLIYQDPTKGIYLLDRSLQEQYIGQDVERYNNDPITSAETIPGTTSVRLTLTSGTVLIYDWFYNQWGGDPYASEAIGATISNGKFTYVQSNGLVQQQTPALFTDNGSAITMSLTTGWMSFAQVQGFQRVSELEILGQYKSSHTLNVVIYSDFDDVTPTQTIQIPVTSDPTNYEYRIRLIRQKCSSIKIKIFDSNQSGTGESFSLSNMALMVGVKKGNNKLSAEKSY